jgi:hypothetical protein
MKDHDCVVFCFCYHRYLLNCGPYFTIRNALTIVYFPSFAHAISLDLSSQGGKQRTLHDKKEYWMVSEGTELDHKTTPPFIWLALS